MHLRAGGLVHSLKLMLVLNVVIENMQRVGEGGTKQAEVEARSSTAFPITHLSNPSKQIYQDLVSITQRKFSPSFEVDEKENIFRRKTTSRSPGFPLCLAAREGGWGARQAQLLRPTPRRQSRGRLRRGQCTNLLFPV